MGSSCGDTGGAHRKNQLCQVGLGWDTLLGFLSELKSRGAFLLYWQNTHLVFTLSQVILPANTNQEHLPLIMGISQLRVAVTRKS